MVERFRAAIDGGSRADRLVNVALDLAEATSQPPAS